jgi:hypothetical protein
VALSLEGEPLILQAVKASGARRAHRGIGLVYGGGALGLLGTVADAAFTTGGEGIRVVSRQFIVQEKVHQSLTRVYEATPILEW